MGTSSTSTGLTRDDRPAGTGHRVDVLHAVDLVEELFEPGGDLVFHLLGGETGGGDEHVGQGDDDLRLFLAGRQVQGRYSEGEGDDNQENRHIAPEEDVDDAAQR